MAEIIVSIGSEEKAVCGLTNSTTCAEVIDVLLKDKHTRVALNDRFTRENERYVIVENYRGNTKVVPPQTPILLLWQTWGKEQCHIKFSLKNETSVINPEKLSVSNCGTACQTPSSHFRNHHFDASDFLQNRSASQLKQLRRNIKEHKRAMHWQQKMTFDDNNNSSVQIRSCFNRNRSTKFTVIFSDEQFVDGISIDSEKERNLHPRFYRYGTPEFLENSCECWCRHSEDLEETNLHHYPYCVKSKHSSASKRRAYRHKRRDHFAEREILHRSSKICFDHNEHTTSCSTFYNKSNIKSETRLSGDDADDEKSILTDFGKLVSSQNFPPYSNQLLPSLRDQYKVENISVSTATVTDSSTTTSSDTSNTSSSSFSGTSSSDTSASSTDWSNEAFFAKRAAAAVAAQQMAQQKSRNNGVSKFFKLAKLNSSKKRKKITTNVTTQSNLPVNNKTKNENFNSYNEIMRSEINKNASGKLPAYDNFYEIEVATKNLPKSETFNHKHSTKKIGVLNSSTAAQNQLNVESVSEKTKEQLQNLILSQQHQLNDLCKKSNNSGREINKIEAQVHKWKAEAQEKSFAADEYLTDFSAFGPSVKEEKFLNKSSSLRYIGECNNPEALEKFIQSCERIVNAQIRIEELKRQADITCQDVRDEVWKLSSNSQTSLQADNLICLTQNQNLTRITSESNLDESESTTSCPSISIAAEDDSSLSTGHQKIIPRQLDTLEIQHAKAEFEANLNLSLRLTSELEEVEMRLSNCGRLLQAKDQSVLDLVRELAQSSEGISPELWEEYGELLTAYDEEVALQIDTAFRAHVESENCMQTQSGSVNLEETKRELCSAPLISDVPIEQQSFFSDAANHVLSPRLPREQCKQDKLLFPNADPRVHLLRRSSTSLELKPKKKPLIKSFSTSLLPMFSVSVSRDGDYDKAKTASKALTDGDHLTSTVISAENAVPRRVVFHHDSVDSLQSSIHGKSNESNSTDDSGNVSAGSTGCDSSGSPRTSSISIESQDSAHSSPLFFHHHFETKTDSCLPSFFPHQNNQPQNHSTENKPKKPPIPAKSPAVISAAALLVEKNVCFSSELLKNERQEQKERLVRRNSTRVKKSSAIVPEISLARRASFGKSRIAPEISSSIIESRQNNSKKLNHDCRMRKQDSVFDPNKRRIRSRADSRPSIIPGCARDAKPTSQFTLKNIPMFPEKTIYDGILNFHTKQSGKIMKSSKGDIVEVSIGAEESNSNKGMRLGNSSGSIERLAKDANGTLV